MEVVPLYSNSLNGELLCMACYRNHFRSNHIPYEVVTIDTIVTWPLHVMFFFSFYIQNEGACAVLNIEENTKILFKGKNKHTPETQYIAFSRSVSPEAD